jgi:two-component system chemotaxis sensor kinase CheA
MSSTATLQEQLINDLLVESHEGLDRFDRELLTLEQGTGNAETMNVIFRVIHTLKGTAGCLGLGRIEKTAHCGENLLSLLRDGKLSAHPRMITALLALSDALRGMLQTLEATGAEGSADHTALLAEIAHLQNPDAAAPAAVAAPANAAFGLFEDEEPLASAPAPAPASLASPVAAPAGAAFGLFEDEEPLPAAPAPAPAPVAIPVAAPEAAVADLATKPSATDSAIRVDVGQLDKVMNLVGELVLARNQIVANTARFDPAALATAAQRLNHITTELQESVMKTRMQPIGNVWAKFPRVVRDVAHELGKQVRLVLDGQSTELDRTIIEAIKDPLTHIVRNSVDHGIEAPEKRRAAGKPAEGLLSLRAFHEGGQVNIEIMDDGGGINVAKVKAKAVAQNLLTPEQAARLSEREALNLIFLPGLSTADKITNVSGRGVGMDVVKTNIEKIGGSIDLHSQPGQGTTLRIKIPLTLAIIPALIVTSGGDRFAIPQVSLLELVRLEGAQARQGIEQLYGAPVYRLRGQLLPLAYLNHEFKFGPAARPGEHPDRDSVNIVVLQADGRTFGLVVDAINDTEEIVVKPLGKQLKGIACFAGATIMGDGRVALILDVVGLAQQAKVVSDAPDSAAAETAVRASADGERPQTLLLFNVGADRRMAIPLSRAARLEEFPAARVERAGAHEVVQYRGRILPLIRVADHVAGMGTAAASADPLQVVVYAENGRAVGLVVGRINDIVEEVVVVQPQAETHGLLGSAVVQGKVTGFLDVPALIRAVNPTFCALAA